MGIDEEDCFFFRHDCISTKNIYYRRFYFSNVHPTVYVFFSIHYNPHSHACFLKYIIYIFFS